MSKFGSKFGSMFSRFTPKQQETITDGEKAQQKNAPQIQEDKKRGMISSAASRVASAVSGAASGAATLAARGAIATAAVAKRHKNPNNKFLITGSVRDTENAFSGAHPMVQGTAVALAGTTACMAGILNIAGLSSVTKGIAEVTERSSKVVGAVLGENRINKVEANKIYAFLTQNGFISDSFTPQQFQSLMDTNIGLSGLIKYLYELAVVYVELKKEQNLEIVEDEDIQSAEAELTKQIDNLEQQIKTLFEASPSKNELQLPENVFENYTTFNNQEPLNNNLNGGYKRKTRKGKKGKGKKATKRHHYKKSKRSKFKNNKRKTKRRHNKRK